MFTLTISTDNAAFKDDGDGGTAEIGRILAAVARRLRGSGGAPCEGTCMDVNGNRVGQWTYTTNEGR